MQEIGRETKQESIKQLDSKHMAVPLQSSLESPKYPRHYNCIGLVSTLSKLYLALLNVIMMDFCEGPVLKKPRKSKKIGWNT